MLSVYVTSLLASFISMKKLFFLPFFCIFSLLGNVFGQSNSPDGLTYKVGFSAMMKLGGDLYRGLDKKYRDQINIQPLSLETDMTPTLRPGEEVYEGEPKPMRAVWISAGFVDLVNRVAHAKAIDQIEKGYFASYIQSLAAESGEKELKPLPNDTNPKYWTEDMLNEQLSNFNSIVGVAVGIKMAHLYLGHYSKYAKQLTDEKGRPVPINNFLTDKEWADAFRLGVKTALDAGCTIEGVIPFFECFDKMKARPGWAAYFVPAKADFAKMKKEMKDIQARFFAGK